MVGSAPTAGSVVALERYPVKSMMGEALNAVEVSEVGLLGDRAYAIRDISDGKIASAKNPRKWPDMFCFRAAFVDPPQSGADVPPVRITLPDGTLIASDQREISQILSRALSRNVTFDAANRHRCERAAPSRADSSPTITSCSSIAVCQISDVTLPWNRYR